MGEIYISNASVMPSLDCLDCEHIYFAVLFSLLEREDIWMRVLCKQGG